MKYLLMIPTVCLTSCGLFSPEQVEALQETSVGIVENLPGAVVGDPASIGNVVVGVLGALGIAFGVKKGIDKVKASPPGKLTGPAE